MAKRKATCKIKVDLPIPGEPPIKIKDPSTIPPPKTLSNSDKDVGMRFFWDPVISASDSILGISILLISTSSLSVFLSKLTSVMVFHSPQFEHFPIQFSVLYPQF